MEQPERHHRVGDTGLHDEEQRERDRADDQQCDDERMPVAERSAFDQGVDDRAERDEGEELTGPVEGDPPAGRAADAHGERQHERAHGHVDGEDETPVPCGQRAAEQRSCRRGDGTAGCPDPERPRSPAGVGERLTDQRHRRRQHQRGRRTLCASCRHEREHGWRQCAQQGRDAEERDPRDIGALRADPIGEVAEAQQQRSEGQRVRVQDPLLCAHVAAEALPDARQCEVHDAHVKGDEEESERRDEEGGPSPRRVRA